MIGVHCVWLDDEEIALMGARGAGLAYCPGSNMFLGDGITRIPEMLRARACGSGSAPTAAAPTIGSRCSTRCARARCSSSVRLLDGTALSAETAFGLGTRAAAGLVGLEAGAIAAGQLADLVAIDLGHLSLQPRNDLLKSVVYAMSPQAVDRRVGARPPGRRAGATTTIAEDEVVARVAALTKGWAI